eukprot:563191-Amphidinium_carterae.1
MDALEGNGGATSDLVEQLKLGMAADAGQPGGSENITFQKINAANRQGAAEWIETDVYSILVVKKDIGAFQILVATTILCV